MIPQYSLTPSNAIRSHVRNGFFIYFFSSLLWIHAGKHVRYYLNINVTGLVIILNPKCRFCRIAYEIE